MATTKDIDITKTGPQGFRQLQQFNNEDFSSDVRPEIREFISRGRQRAASYTLYNPYEQAQQDVSSSLAGTATPWGESIFDEATATEEQFQNLGDVRAENQPWFAKIGAGLAKGTILAGTTFLDGTVGLVLGAGNAVSEDRLSGLWDNEFSKAMQSINEWSEQALPNYYTTAEQEQPWYENVFTANFLGDKFIKNLGFTVGAFYSGGITAGAAKGAGKLAMAGAKRLGAGIGTLKNVANASSIVASGVGAFTSALNEGRIEALNNSKDWFDLNKMKLDDEHYARMQAIKDQYENTEVYNSLVQAENEAYNEALGKLTEDRTKMGNMDMLFNLPILLASNVIQFGKLYSNGFTTAKKALNIVGKPGSYASGSTKLGLAGNLLKGSISEGTEEISQKAASVVSGNYYSTDVNNYYKALTDREASQETLSWAKSFAQGINETVNDGSSWEEFFIGSLTGALGMPSFRSARTTEGKFQSPIYLREGIYGAIQDYNKDVARENEIATYMNNRFNSPEFKNYYQGLIRHNKYQNDMNKAVEQGDEFEFKNAEHAQMVSDIHMFDTAGKIEDLKQAITEASGTSREDLESIVTNTTSKTEDGKLVGPFAQYATLDDSGNIIANFGSQGSVDEMTKRITENRDKILSTIDEYQRTKDEVILNSDGNLSDAQISELTWMQSQISNWVDRAEGMSDEIKTVLGKVIGNLHSFSRFSQQLRDIEGSKHANLTDTYHQLDKHVNSLEKAISSLEVFRSMDSKSLAVSLASNDKFVKGLIDEINNLEDDVITDEEKKSVVSKLQDIIKLGNASELYKNKFREYQSNPQKQAEDHVKADEAAVQEDKKKKSGDLRTSLIGAKNLQEFRDVISSQDDKDITDSILKALENEGNEMAKNYRETSLYNSEVQRIINSSTEPTQTKQDALKLLQDQFNHSENLEQLANPNSIYVNNENAFDEASEGDVEVSASRFQEAQYELQKAMSQVNNDNKFKDRFSPEYKKPVEKREGPVRGDNRGTTGDSGTSTLPTVKVSNSPATEETPTGNITKEEIIEENKKFNEEDTPQNPKKGEIKQYYRPAIPELHIEASKLGDFRPFDVVAMEKNGLDFSEIYDYLKEAGAFDYVNEGNLVSKDGNPVELGFMIDPAFEERVAGKSWHTKPTIFIIDTRNNQVVGSLDEGSSVNNFEGLAGLEERVRKEYSQSKAETSSPERFIATPTTKVSKIMVGKIPFNNEERSLANIPNVSSESREPVFGIIKNGVLTTNGKIDDSLIIKPVDMGQKEGRLYLLIPNGAGKYSPAAVRVKHFNKEEFNLDDITVSSTIIGENIKNAITKLAESVSQDDISLAMQDLAQNLFVQDIMVSHFIASAGEGIVISRKVRKADGSYEFININGEEHIKEEKYSIYFNTSKKQAEINGFLVDASIGMKSHPELYGIPKDTGEIVKEITNILIGFNLPLQVSTGRINKDSYNANLINSNILTSNIENAVVVGNWFTTDYFDDKGNLQPANNPASVTQPRETKRRTPVDGTNSVITGTKIMSVFSNNSYYIDLSTNTIRRDNGEVVAITDENRILLDLAWAQEFYGDKTIGVNMVDNKVVTSEGKVLDRAKQMYLEGTEAQAVKDAIAARKKPKAKLPETAQKIVDQIRENQSRVDKSKTDSDYYYILEDDGQYHQYDRVHTRIGNNKVLTKKDEEELKKVETELSKSADNNKDYDAYLHSLESQHKVDLSQFLGKTDITSRKAIVDTIRERILKGGSSTALTAGSAVDTVVRQFFSYNDVSKIDRPSNMSVESFNDLLSTLSEIKSTISDSGETFLTDNIVLYQKYPDGTRVAGEVDILAIDKNGNFKIYDVKTSGYSFYAFDRNGRPENYFLNAAPWQKMSNEKYYTLQLSAYKNLFESQYSTTITDLKIIPFVLTKDAEGNILGIKKEDDFPITYNPAVNVPLLASKIQEVPATPSVPTTPSTIGGNQIISPIFNTSLESQNHTEALSDNHSFQDSNEKVGYYEIDGRLYKGYLLPITTIEGIEVYVTKTPNITKGFGKTAEHVASNTYYAVFPNGKVWKVGKDDGRTHSEIVEYITKALSGNPQRVKDMANEKTLLFDPTEPKTSSNNTEAMLASFVTQKEKAANPTDDEFEDDDVLEMLRKASDNEVTVWNQEQELEWLSKVLPNIRAEHRLKVVNGLIKVGKKGIQAWGQFDKGIITLSDIAAEGTTYHEAFHVVFNLLLDDNERQALYNEAKELYGEKDNLSLEEDMAEGFREYVMTRQNRSLGRRILDFFKELFIKVTNWNNFRPSLLSYYRRINAGEYARSEFKVPSISESRNREEQYTEEMKEILRNALRDSQGRLLAPNGRPSNLTEKQYAQVRTKAFRKWFGDWINDPENASKIVDENGEPLVVYHSSAYNDDTKFIKDIVPTFELDSKVGRYQVGISYDDFNRLNDESVSYIMRNNWVDFTKNHIIITEAHFATTEDRIEAYEAAKKSAKRLHKLYPEIILRDINNIDIPQMPSPIPGGVVKTEELSDDKELWEQVLRYDSTYEGYAKTYFTDKKSLKYSHQFGRATMAVFLNIKKPINFNEITEEIKKDYFRENDFGSNNIKSVKLLKAGYDGFIVNHLKDRSEYVAFTPNQIKSATDNSGEFSTTNNDIRYRIVPNSSFMSLTEEMQKNLLKKGWTAEKFDSVSQEERDHAIKCIAF